MIFDDLRALPDTYRHVYLSPHLDDAPLSCGGAIAAQVAAGEPVLVAACCTAAPSPDGPFSALALEFHREWGLSPEEAVAARLREEQAALAILGADELWAGMLDAIYRHPAAYNARATLFGRPDPADPLLPAVQGLIADLRARLPRATFYCPMGVGSHVDHLVTQRAAEAALGRELAYYEDFPYVARAGALEQRLAEIGAPMAPELVPIGATLERKIAAISVYASQLPELAHNQLGRPVAPAEAADLFAEVVAGYAARAGGGSPAERLWRRV